MTEVPYREIGVRLEKKIEARKPARAQSSLARLGAARESRASRAELGFRVCWGNEPSQAALTREAQN
jgi:hypothetical protein